MRSKEEYYQLVMENRRLAADEKITECACENTLCEWHGKCKECVALHRYHNDHLPRCLQSMVRNKLDDLVAVIEMKAIAKEVTPVAYRNYVKERDEQEDKNN